MKGLINFIQQSFSRLFHGRKPIPQRKSCEDKRVTAIVSTYKSERLLDGCLEDLEAQTIADQLEIIVIDSGSPENERSIVERFQNRFDNIIYIRTPTRESLYRSWNRGITLAQGNYITNANTDDRHRHDALETLADALDKRPDVSLVYADSYVTETENESFEKHTRADELTLGEFNFVKLTKECCIGPQPMWRRSVHETYGNFDESFESAGDWDFWLRLAKTEDFLHLNEFLGLYLRSPNGIEFRDPQLSQKEANCIVQKLATKRVA